MGASVSSNGFFLCLLLSTCKCSDGFPCQHPRTTRIYLEQEHSLQWTIFFPLSCASWILWEKLVSAPAEKPGWGWRGVCVTKRLNAVNCGFSPLWVLTFRMKGCLVTCHLLTCSSSHPSARLPAPLAQYWISRWCPAYLSAWGAARGSAADVPRSGPGLRRGAQSALTGTSGP